MKICVTAASGSLDAQVDPRFGRCQCFVIVDLDTMEFEAMPNTSIGAMSGAGIQAAQAVANKGVEVVITGNVGPNAFQTLSAAGINVITGAFGTVRDVIERYKSGQLQATPGATVGGRFGVGMGRGGGRGMGMGRGMGLMQQTPMGPPIVPPMSQMPKEQELQMLEAQARILEEQLSQIKKRLDELKK
ncbi:MAG: NifB/NifX family molybdenum-iron cluster-binding protein [Methanocellales archaeon]|nr:NifB/NifX family molybdenum-iron cluster-binding protein [Methanocellales archaeon]